MPISQFGALNTTALVVPDLYVQIVPPQNLILNGVPTNVVGVVGTANWGPKNQPAIIATMADYARVFGSLQARKYDMGTHVATAAQQGAQAFRCVRVTDGTDTSASGSIFDGTIAAGHEMISLAAIWSGSLGNTVTFTMLAGSAANTWRAITNGPYGAEQFNNIPGPITSNSAGFQDFWSRVAVAVNSGTGVARGPSQTVVATLGASAAFIAPALGMSCTLGGGTDGAGVAAAALIGVDTIPRTGMYVLRGQGCSLLDMADLDDSTVWTTVAQYALAEGLYALLSGPNGDTIANAVTVKQSAGLDSYSVKLMFGDWVYWTDPVAGKIRLVSPTGFVAGRLANLSPEQSSLNKPLYSVVGTQKSSSIAGMTATYSTAELAVMLTVGIDVIANPQPGGAYWGVRGGHNSSSNSGTNGDNYTRMTNYIAATLNAGMGVYVGQLINVGLFRLVRSTMLTFLQAMLGQGLLGSTDGSLPFGVVCDISNNPDTRTTIGYLQADVQVKYQAINEKFLVNLEGGQTVTVNRQTLPSGQVGV
jgi:hypothetical protein